MHAGYGAVVEVVRVLGRWWRLRVVEVEGMGWWWRLRVWGHTNDTDVLLCTVDMTWILEQI